MSQAYIDFLTRKIPQAEVLGFEPSTEPHESLKPHQRDIASWAMRGGRRAVFANFGLGKTRMNLQVAKWITDQKGRYLIIAPLGVRAEFIDCDGPAMGVKVRYVTCDAEIQTADLDAILITNKALEQIGKLPASFMLFPPVSRNADIWTDIARMRTLNMEQSRRNQEMHVCPLQLDIIKRLITRYTNPGETVLDPFGGIMSVPFQAIKMERKAIGIELNPEYWRCGVGYCEMAENELQVPTLFDLGMVSAQQPVTECRQRFEP